MSLNSVFYLFWSASVLRGVKCVYHIKINRLPKIELIGDIFCWQEKGCHTTFKSDLSMT